MEILEKLIIEIARRFPNLPEGRIWEMNDMKRIYFNHPEDRRGSMYIDIGRDVIIGKMEGYWLEKVGLNDETEFRIIINDLIDTLKGGQAPQAEQKAPNLQLASEYFSLKKLELSLQEYQIQSSERNLYLIGGKLAYRLNRETDANWIFSSYKLLSNKIVEQEKIKVVLHRLWVEFDDFNNIENITYCGPYKPRPMDLANWINNNELYPALREFNHKSIENPDMYVQVQNVKIVRKIDSRAAVLAGQPAISLSVSSDMIYEHDLKTFADLGNEIDGLFVKEKEGSLSGQIIKQIGPMQKYRRRLKALCSREENEYYIVNAKDDEPIVRVRAGNSEYDYPISALYVVIRSDDYERLKINAEMVSRKLRIDPRDRVEIVDSFVADANTSLGPRIDNTSHPRLFIKGEQFGFKPLIKFHKGPAEIHDDKTILQLISDHGVFLAPEEIGNTIRIRLISDTISFPDKFKEQLRNDFRKIQIEVEYSEKIFDPENEYEVEHLLSNLILKQDFDLLLVTYDNAYFNKLYHLFKSKMVGYGIPNQIILRHNLSSFFVRGNVVLGILGKLGYTPFVLADPLEFTDYVVGMDISRKKKDTNVGTINISAVARIYGSNGAFVQYLLDDRPIEGETIPEQVLKEIFPARIFENKRVVIHRDGYFRGQEMQHLKSWGKVINCTFMFVEIIKRNAPRIFRYEQSYLSPIKGDMMKISPQEYLLVSSLPPFEGSTPRPLRIRVHEGISIREGVESVLKLTLLHKGSIRSPRLPITIHYSDAIAGLAMDGIKPRTAEGDHPYWL